MGKKRSIVARMAHLRRARGTPRVAMARKVMQQSLPGKWNQKTHRAYVSRPSQSMQLRWDTAIDGLRRDLGLAPCQWQARLICCVARGLRYAMNFDAESAEWQPPAVVHAGDARWYTSAGQSPFNRRYCNSEVDAGVKLEQVQTPTTGAAMSISLQGVVGVLVLVAALAASP
eukprot:scaffold3964_cov336-Prasinococcus_capsulatus_cf.AAC.6